MKKVFLFLMVNIITEIATLINPNNILPFSSIKFVGEDIFITLDANRGKWHKLLSIDNIGYDAIEKYAIEHFGKSKCDYEIECYKYNIIANFPGIYSGMNGGKPFPIKSEWNLKKIIKFKMELMSNAIKKNLILMKNMLLII